ncbi:hypothetical protein ASPACDRAFT_1882712 [Aspergillus aculeatus ATCC 16872]|uniref:Uncharacterized protein n=1 Tax=Aspergillus aculeatus (strain ATCC 16872 / CBS 172.66 / WB 5094) TaxID=690307 RepID=A0A1L9WL86_ASPA1|nr:uncharacterized protein ASPACDRAFT_1882712 [Aspergillus aculeatus ATCC 16872]OJJ96919.1 hypothetical protein ASPACDRAFT_1882712 [Aspergillus aculeatus ATCC 16872]
MLVLLLLLYHFIASTVVSASPNGTHYSYHELWILQTYFWQNFLYPTNRGHIDANDSSIFAADVQGRVHATRTFDGRELNNEYIFGLFSQPDHPGIFGPPIAYNITQFAATDNTAAATTLITFNITTFQLVVPAVIDTWFQYDSSGKITQYDAVFRWLDYLFVPLMQAARKMFHLNDSVQIQNRVAALLADTICQTHQDHCQGANQQYASKEDCVVFLTQRVRFGLPYEMGRNTLLCREVHDNMVRFNPPVHCPHIGPSGGGYCVDDMTYQQVVLEKYFRHSWVPYGYADHNPWVAVGAQ